MRIPNFLSKDDYLQNPIMRRFLRDHKLGLVQNRADYIRVIEEFANQNTENKNITKKWLLKVAKEGSKDICYRQIHDIMDWHRDYELVEAKIKETFPNCPQKNILSYKNTAKREMIEYNIISDDTNKVIKIDFTFSKLFLYGELGTVGSTTVFPIYVEIYLNEGFIISRGKAKSTLYNYNENNAFLSSDIKVDTMAYAVEIIDEIVDMFGFKTERNAKLVKNENAKMLFKIYHKYSFTPDEVSQKVASQSELVNNFVNILFENLQLTNRNKQKAILDANILIEKFISINGNNEDIFKKDRPAYLIKVTADDEIELTRIDTTSNKEMPLQCTEAFFDSKKSVMKSQQCKKLHLIFRRRDETYFTKANPLVVQLGTHKNHGYIKTMQYAEEADIQNVLQAIFENY